MDIITENTYSSDQHAFMFAPTLRSPVVLLCESYRSEMEYDSDPQAETTALTAISQAAKSLSGNVFAVMAEANIAPISKLRSYRGCLFSSPLKSIDHCDLEVSNGKGYSRLGAVISLDDARPDSDPVKILHFRTSIFLITPLDIEGVCRLAEAWMSGNDQGVLSLNLYAIAAHIAGNPDSMILRYFFADNGKSERVALIANETAVGDQARAFFENIRI
ncbi:hypothetical protein A6U98_14810 [Rhizobium sp. WYCCWR10014]|uniref:hypothetical protein n=1 Tax=Rhizobium sp. WYCCWR10014 TaxID=1825933 RepID=UPI0007E49DFB|nr:hypothetical protein [Rhizobium sp. WYCCWR10014]OAV49912.1 hypothetical protein A6U98_14810 [Rhizobium sp. WYCCWR10014]